jgi:hypothetical protein
VWAVLCAYVLGYVRGVFVFFAGFKQDSPGFLGTLVAVPDSTNSRIIC